MNVIFTQDRCLLLLILVFVMINTNAESQLNVGISGDMRSSFPGVRRDSNSDDVLINVTESLVAYDQNLNVQPMLAASIDIVDGGRRYHFKLREGVVFHNGAAFTAEDIKYNFDKILNPDTGFQCLNFFDGSMGVKIKSVNVLSPLLLEIVLENKSAIFLEMLASIQCPVAAMHEDSWGSNGEWIGPIGTGPFVLEEWRKGSYIRLQKFSDYRSRSELSSGLSGAKAALVDNVKFTVIPDTMARNSALISGQIDVAPTLSPISTLVLRRNDGVKVLQAVGSSRRALIFQTNDPVLADVNLRKAFDFSIDKSLMVDITSFGFSKENPSLISTPSVMYSEVHALGRQYDLNKAKNRLAISDYNGEVISILTTKAHPVLFDIAMVTEAMLKKIGVKTRIVVLEWSAFINRYFNGDFQVMAFEFSPRLSPHMGYVTALGDDTIYPYLWSDSTANGLLQAAAIEDDFGRRKVIYEQIHEELLNLVPMVNLYNPTVNDGVSMQVQGYRPWGGAKPRLWGVRFNAKK